ncbi:MAG: methyltransferase domain-containing protein [Deltaproteobacteria bacterium]|nr:methyltransferase domain-containing protein [Deltaproteobacteria bacterium]
MQPRISRKDRDRILAGIHKKYRKVADSPEGLFKFPTGKAGLKGLGYAPELIRALPEKVAASYCGVGNPFSIGAIHKDESVLDIGCGAGVDTIFAGLMAGPAGKAVGIDLTAEMLRRAEANLALTDLKNITFKRASGEKLPFEDSRFDVVISNGAINLIPDKDAAVKEAMRVLKPNGRLMIADQILKGGINPDKRERIDKWAR